MKWPPWRRERHANGDRSKAVVEAAEAQVSAAKAQRVEVAKTVIKARTVVRRADRLVAEVEVILRPRERGA